jgi:hypothetical protein
MADEKYVVWSKKYETGIPMVPLIFLHYLHNWII